MVLMVLSCAADLEVYVLNTEADMQDLMFPHSYDSDSILQISALALQQYSSNGLSHATETPTSLQRAAWKRKKRREGEIVSELTRSSLPPQVR